MNDYFVWMCQNGKWVLVPKLNTWIPGYAFDNPVMKLEVS